MTSAHSFYSAPARPARNPRKMTGLRRHRIADNLKEAACFVMVLGLFGALLVAMGALEIAIWAPSLPPGIASN
jgi:uncharacterized RDD family membrane protein YckC